VSRLCRSPAVLTDLRDARALLIERGVEPLPLRTSTALGARVDPDPISTVPGSVARPAACARSGRGSRAGPRPPALSGQGDDDDLSAAALDCVRGCGTVRRYRVSSQRKWLMPMGGGWRVGIAGAPTAARRGASHQAALRAEGTLKAFAGCSSARGAPSGSLHPDSAPRHRRRHYELHASTLPTPKLSFLSSGAPTLGTGAGAPSLAPRVPQPSLPPCLPRHHVLSLANAVPRPDAPDNPLSGQCDRLTRTSQASSWSSSARSNRRWFHDDRHLGRPALPIHQLAGARLSRPLRLPGSHALPGPSESDPHLRAHPPQALDRTVCILSHRLHPI